MFSAGGSGGFYSSSIKLILSVWCALEDRSINPNFLCNQIYSSWTHKHFSSNSFCALNLTDGPPSSISRLFFFLVYGIKNAFSRYRCTINSSQGRAKITFKRNRKFYVLRWEVFWRKYSRQSKISNSNLPSSLSSSNLSMHCFFWNSLAQFTVFMFGGGVGGKCWSVFVQKSGREGVLSAILMPSTLATFETRSHGW